MVNAKVKYYLDLQNKTLQDLANYMGIHINSLYLKLRDKTPIRYEEKEKINKYLKLTEKEIKDLWGNK